VAVQNVRLKTCILTSNTTDMPTALDGGDSVLWLGLNQDIANSRQIATSLLGAQGGGLIPIPCSYSTDRDGTQIVYADLGLRTHTWVKVFTVSAYDSDGVTPLQLRNLSSDPDLAKKLSSTNLIIEFDNAEIPR
jgi:hypothetical protein